MGRTKYSLGNVGKAMVCLCWGLLLLSCKTEDAGGYVLPEAPDYGSAEAWYTELEDGRGVDVFYVAPTCIWDWVNEDGETVHFEGGRIRWRRVSRMPWQM